MATPSVPVSVKTTLRQNRSRRQPRPVAVPVSVKTMLRQNSGGGYPRHPQFQYQSKRRCAKTAPSFQYQSKRRCAKTRAVGSFSWSGSSISQNDAAPKRGRRCSPRRWVPVSVKTTLRQNRLTFAYPNAQFQYQSKRRCAKTLEASLSCATCSSISQNDAAPKP